METRVAVISIIVDLPGDGSIAAVNALLHEYGNEIIGRMGIPHKEKQISIISVVMDAPQDKINTLSGKLGKLSGVTSKVLYSKV